MDIKELIIKKRNNQELTKQEIDFIIKQYVNKKIKDYQMSAFLMTIVFNGMNSKETAALTLAMANSGKNIDLSSIPGIKVDKHSTGGVGDKTTLIIAPILAALNIPVAKMSGRGLGHTGGTIDKLESIDGFSAELSEENFIKQVKDINIAIMSQTDDLVPADKKIYALRDVTATVDSIPLIASSIMSKKIATGSDAILLDVKCGDGAFMKNLAEAENLSKEMIKIGKELKRDVRVEITNMDRPIGKSIGNRNEILEAIKTLEGKGSKDLETLCFSSIATILKQAKKVKTDKEAYSLINEVIKNKKALDKFFEFVKHQGGDVDKLKSESFWIPHYKIELFAEQEGYLEITSSFKLAVIASKLGASRLTKTDKIDFNAGIELNKKTNDLVKKGDLILTLFSSKPIEKSLIKQAQAAFKFNNQKIENKIIFKRMR
ncbi:thymidine phosphorylase [Mesomycoplasma neurolyticum]|uniref:Pyrimidine-nucleoside phosphorylase n=1 Tax=Mesomycoplasma neurolyticum TaxID=2120 RepID=A0A449A557_9BACT|nr:thymidine phosphorylase [Mesomycoplasma neurolyticum]VEU59367.1 Pyrimidine-nucleoside phosphorylase [Mesomycoplasma neurolyticum]